MGGASPPLKNKRNEWSMDYNSDCLGYRSDLERLRSQERTPLKLALRGFFLWVVADRPPMKHPSDSEDGTGAGGHTGASARRG